MALTALQERAFDLELKLTAFPSRNQIDALDRLFEDVYKGLLPKPQDYEARKIAVDFVNGLARDKLLVTDVKKRHGVCNARAFGSFTMDMFTSTSDLDISLNVECDSKGLTREEGVHLLKKLTKLLYKLQSNGVVRGIQPVFKAKVPVVKFIHCNTGVECDVSVENRDGIIKSELLRIFSSIDSRFRKLCFLLKAWANAHGINSSKDNTLNSLSLILLAALHLQTRVPAILPPFSRFMKGADATVSSHGLPIVERQVKAYKDFGNKNGESVVELFNSFLTKIMAVKDLWQEGLCASAFEGTWKLTTTPNWIYVEDFASPLQNAARSVNGNGFEAIYECCNQTVTHLKDYFLGIHEPDYLKTWLFELQLTSAVHKRKRATEDLPKGESDQHIQASIENSFSRFHESRPHHMPLHIPSHMRGNQATMLGRDYFPHVGYSSIQSYALPTSNIGLLMTAKRSKLLHEQNGHNFMSPFASQKSVPDNSVILHPQGYSERIGRESQQFHHYIHRNPQFSEPKPFVVPLPPMLDLHEQQYMLGERTAELAYRGQRGSLPLPPPPLPLLSPMGISLRSEALRSEALRSVNLGGPLNAIPSYGYSSRLHDRF